MTVHLHKPHEDCVPANHHIFWPSWQVTSKNSSKPVALHKLCTDCIARQYQGARSPLAAALVSVPAPWAFAAAAPLVSVPAAPLAAEQASELHAHDNTSSTDIGTINNNTGLSDHNTNWRRLFGDCLDSIIVMKHKRPACTQHTCTDPVTWSGEAAGLWCCYWQCKLCNTCWQCKLF
jgi:hypothetical protein